MESQESQESMVAVEAKLKGLIARVLKIPIEKVQNHARFREDLGVDSLDLVLLLYEIEDQMGIALTDDDAKKILTVSDAIRLAGQFLPR
ncbi:MAG TPA: phosphopantetheine-binding protein [Planctomycetota bacterium]|nr:phosphopantetheine-binding protein [Planctomycetota bacterium]